VYPRLELERFVTDGSPIRPFALERYFAAHEFSADYLLSASDCEALSMAELLGLATPSARALWEGLRLGYTETAGHPLLREAIAGIYDGVDPDQVMVIAPEEGIFLAMHALLEPDDQVVCTFPGYQSLYEVARSKGCQISLWRPEEVGGWRFDLGRLEELLSETTKLVVVNFPHNPTGALPTRDDFAAVLEVARRAGARVFSDEMYRFLEDDPDATLPSACERDERAVSLFGLSKTFGLPGLRVGWLVAQDAVLRARIAELRDYTTICSSAPSEVLGLMALEAREPILASQRARLGRNRGLLDGFFGERESRFGWRRPQAGSVGLARLLDSPSAEGFCRELLAATGIMAVPSTLFDFGDHHVRVGFGREDLPVVLGRLARYLEG